jgi:hypothetical protein
LGIDPTLVCASGVLHTVGKLSMRAIILLQTSSRSEVCKGIMRPQNRESPNCQKFGTPTWESQDKKPFGCGPRGELQSILYGESGGFLRVQAVVSFVSPKSLVVRLSTKGALESELTNLWLVGCKFKWVIEKLVTLPSPIPEPQHAPSTPFSVRAGSVLRTSNNSAVWLT